MSYEKVAISETTSAIPSQPLPQMREDREINPYQIAKPRITNGQPIINSEAKTLVPEESKVSATEESVTLSPQMAALARKEQRFRQQQLDLKKQAESLEAERAEIAELKAMKAKLAAKDYSGLENLVKYDEYTNYLIEKESSLTPEQKAVKQLAEEIESLKNSQKEDVVKRFDAAVNERRKAVKELVEVDPQFSKIKKAKMEEAVVKHIIDTWEHESKELSPEEAAKDVQLILIEKANSWKSILEEEVQEAKEDIGVVAEEIKKQLPPLKPGIKTLTNNMAVTGEIKRTVKSFQHMSDSERWAEARRRAEEKLQKGIR